MARPDFVKNNEEKKNSGEEVFVFRQQEMSRSTRKHIMSAQERS